MIYNVIYSSLKPVKDSMYIFFYKTDKAALTKLLMIVISFFFFPVINCTCYKNNLKKKKKGIALDGLNTA